MEKNSRLVVVDTAKKIINIFQGKTLIASFEYADSRDLTPELIEDLRTTDYKEIA